MKYTCVTIISKITLFLFLFNEISQTKTKNECDKLLSEDFSKLLVSLIEEEPKVDDERTNLEENTPSYDKDKIIIIQRRWRKYKIKFNLKLKEDNKRKIIHCCYRCRTCFFLKNEQYFKKC